MKPIMNYVISDSQNVFMNGRQIFDNAIVGFEFMHKLWRQKAGRKGLFCLKLDMNKAYDGVEWEFIR